MSKNHKITLFNSENPDIFGYKSALVRGSVATNAVNLVKQAMTALPNFDIVRIRVTTYEKQGMFGAKPVHSFMCAEEMTYILQQATKGTNHEV